MRAVELGALEPNVYRKYNARNNLTPHFLLAFNL